jgi:Tetratricopeptide repeat
LGPPTTIILGVLARAGALCAAGELAFGQGDLALADELFEESLALYRGLGDDAGVAAVLVELGQVARAQGDHDHAAALSEEGLARRLGDLRVAAIALSTLGRVERQRGNLKSALLLITRKVSTSSGRSGTAGAAPTRWPTWRWRCTTTPSPCTRSWGTREGWLARWDVSPRGSSGSQLEEPLSTE